MVGFIDLLGLLQWHGLFSLVAEAMEVRFRPSQNILTLFICAFKQIFNFKQKEFEKCKRDNYDVSGDVF